MAKAGKPHLIVIASSQLDANNTKPVAELLRENGFEVLVYEADKVAFGEDKVALHLKPNGEILFTYNNRKYDLQQVKAAWYRRPNEFGPIIADRARYFSVNISRKETQQAFWNLVPRKAWLNVPTYLRGEDEKVSQMLLAHSVGFNTPESVISNEWLNICRLQATELAFKVPEGLIFIENKPKHAYTTVLSKDNLPTHSLPFPGMWQPFIRKKKEWRVTVVGDRVFGAAIYTSSSAQHDWRAFQDTPKVTFKKETFPAQAAEKCRQMLSLLGLKFGAFDLIETPEGEIVFLEVNTNGQYGWLEDELGFAVSEAIADELTKIALSNI